MFFFLKLTFNNNSLKLNLGKWTRFKHVPISLAINTLPVFLPHHISKTKTDDVSLPETKEIIYILITILLYLLHYYKFNELNAI